MMSTPDDRRFADKPELDPAAVRSLPPDHPALLENRTLFPSTVVDVDENFTGRLLVSGKNNRKLGERILKGKFNRYALFGLSLEERATCPATCDVRAFCYGNGMQWAPRHRIRDLDLFNVFLEDEIRTIIASGAPGLMVRLHVLGDFPSIDYVGMWADLLDEHDNLACYGSTHRLPRDLGGDDIGDAILSLKRRFPDRFRLRWSSASRSFGDGARVIDFVPDKPRLKGADGGSVCPAQIDATACCASCGLCWGSPAETVIFIKHGPKSMTQLAENSAAAETRPSQPAGAPDAERVRPIAALKIAGRRDVPLSAPPQLRLVDPCSLQVEARYQRDLSARSMRLIRRIVLGWDWTKFKPPIVAETADGMFIIDGQHTAIAAASHPEVKQIPVMLVAAADLKRRAEAFVAHNRDRLTMTPAQILYGEAAAGNAVAIAVLEAVKRGGGEIPRTAVAKNYAKAGQIAAIGALRSIGQTDGAATVERIVRIAVLSKVAPVVHTVIRAIRLLIKEKKFTRIGALADAEIARAIASIENIDAVSRHYAAETGQGKDRACAALIAQALEKGAAA